MRFRVWLLVLALAGITGGVFAVTGAAPAEQTPGPQYTKDGQLLRPRDVFTWVFVGASIGLSYAEEGGPEERGPGELGHFHNVYLHPAAYEHYARTGEFPEKTMLALAIYSRAQKVSPNQQGFFEDQLVSLEMAVKDHEHFEEGWAYFGFRGPEGLREQAEAFPRSRCYDCHAEHGAQDNVFLQFYPVLRQLKKGTTTD